MRLEGRDLLRQHRRQLLVAYVIVCPSYLVEPRPQGPGVNCTACPVLVRLTGSTSTELSTRIADLRW